MIRERPMWGGHPASLVRLIDDVVVDESTGLVELERCTEVGERHLVERGAGTERVADVRHESTESLAAGDGSKNSARKLFGSTRSAGAGEEMCEAGGRRLVDMGTQRCETVAQSHEATLSEEPRGA